MLKKLWPENHRHPDRRVAQVFQELKLLRHSAQLCFGGGGGGGGGGGFVLDRGGLVPFLPFVTNSFLTVSGCAVIDSLQVAARKV